MLGRESETHEVDQLVAGARVGRSALLLVSGEAGIGKTALLDYVAARATGMRVHWARGNEAESAVPFGGLLQLLRPALPLLDRIPAPQREALSAALALQPAASGDRFAVGAATLSLLCRYAEDEPLALLVDDIHLVDRPSVEALLFAGRRLVADRVLLCAATRSGELAGTVDDLPQVRLSGLPPTAARDLVRAHAPHLARSALDRLYSATGGNPLALLELAGDLPRWQDQPPEAPLPVPSVVAHAFSRRLARLTPSARATLLVAAVGGGDLRVIARACDLLGADVASTAEAESAGLVRVDDERVEFRHPLLRSAVYGGAPPRERRAAHRAVARALPDDDVSRRAWHLSAAALGPDADVAALLERAGSLATQRHAHAVASTSYERAARHTPDHPTRSRRLVEAAEQARLAGAGARAVRLLDEAEPGTRSSAIRAAVAARSGSLTEARDILVAAADAEPDPDQAVVLLAEVVYVCLYLADLSTALQAARQLDGLLPRVHPAGAVALGTLAAGMARILAGVGGTEQVRHAVALLTSDEAARLDEHHRGWLLFGPLWLRDAGTGEQLRRAANHARERSAVGELPFLLWHLGRDEATTNRWARAEATYTEAIRLAKETGQSTELAMAAAGLSWLQARQGRARDCRVNAGVAREIGRSRQVTFALVWERLALAELALGLGDPAAALRGFAEVETLMAGVGLADVDLSPAPETVDALERLGRHAEAAEVARSFAERAAAKGQPWACARAERSLGLVGTDDELDTHFGAALHQHAQTLDAFETACTQLAYGARLRRARRRVDARPVLRAVVVTFQELGAEPWAERAAVELEATGEVARRRDLTATDLLTPQELQIALLLVEGRTTRETAAAMFLSPKTVEYHLRKVYTKLRIGSRTELAESISQRPG